MKIINAKEDAYQLFEVGVFKHGPWTKSDPRSQDIWAAGLSTGQETWQRGSNDHYYYHLSPVAKFPCGLVGARPGPSFPCSWIRDWGPLLTHAAGSRPYHAPHTLCMAGSGPITPTQCTGLGPPAGSGGFLFASLNHE